MFVTVYWQGCYLGGFLFATDHVVASAVFTLMPDAGKLNQGGTVVCRSHYITHVCQSTRVPPGHPQVLAVARSQKNSQSSHKIPRKLANPT